MNVSFRHEKSSTHAFPESHSHDSFSTLNLTVKFQVNVFIVVGWLGGGLLAYQPYQPCDVFNAKSTIYIYIYIYIRGAYDKFPDFFVQAFKIVVDSWKFGMLLLYILWDDRPIFMISASNEQL